MRLLYVSGQPAERDVRFILLLNVVQSAAESAPVVVEDARLIPRTLLAKVRPLATQERDIVACLLLNVVQSDDLRSHVAVAEAYGILNVWVDPTELILKSVPAFPIANDCEAAESPFMEEIPEPASVIQTGAPPLMVRYCPLDPFTSQIVFPTRESPLLKVRTFSFPLKVLKSVYESAHVVVEFTIFIPKSPVPLL